MFFPTTVGDKIKMLAKLKMGKKCWHGLILGVVLTGVLLLLADQILPRYGGWQNVPTILRSSSLYVQTFIVSGGEKQDTRTPGHKGVADNENNVLSKVGRPRTTLDTSEGNQQLLSNITTVKMPVNGTSSIANNDSNISTRAAFPSSSSTSAKSVMLKTSTTKLNISKVDQPKPTTFTTLIVNTGAKNGTINSASVKRSNSTITTLFQRVTASSGSDVVPQVNGSVNAVESTRDPGPGFFRPATLGPIDPVDLALAANETQCKFPHLIIDDPSIKQYLKDFLPLKCSEMKNWVYSSDGLFLLDPEAVRKYSPIDCTYFNLQRNGDHHYTETQHPHFKNGTALLGDIFKVKCTGGEGAQYNNLHVGVKKVDELLNRTLNTSTPKLDMDVLIYLIDSISRVNFLRKLPKFYKVITEEMEATVMEGFNIVGDGTPWSLIPIITGHFQPELYEARKRFANASFVDDWPLHFKDFKAAGYVTSYAEEQPIYSFFSYKLKGFNNPPVDHYLRPYEQAVTRESKSHKPYCLGDTPRSLALCKYFKEKQDIYRPRNTRTYSMLFSSETSHDDYNYVQVLDEHWAREFGEQYRQGYFNKTIVIIMGDHGRRFGAIRKTQTGKTEEKLPFFALLLPPDFRQKYPKSYRNVRVNSKRLFTPFDIHETLNDVIHWPGDGGVGNLSLRGISAFKEIPAERSCSQAAIKPHFCSCLEWEEMATNDSVATGAVQYVIDTFNAALTAAEGLCVNLTLRTLVSARKLHPNHDLLAFKESKDYDNIQPDLTADATVKSVLMQIRFTTNPSGADYEVSLDYFMELAQFVMTLDDVSRLDMYGNQPHCVMDTQQQLRQYCYCNDLLQQQSTTATTNP